MADTTWIYSGECYFCDKDVYLVAQWFEEDEDGEDFFVAGVCKKCFMDRDLSIAEKYEYEARNMYQKYEEVKEEFEVTEG